MQITDNLLYKYVPKAEKLILEQIPLEYQLVHNFSKNFDRKMKKLFKITKRNLFTKAFVVQAKRVAVILLIIIAVIFTTVMSAEALRIRFFEMITEIHKELTTITFVQDDEPLEVQFQILKPKYIPDGYKIVEEEKTFTTADGVFILDGRTPPQPLLSSDMQSMAGCLPARAGVGRVHKKIW